MEKQLLEEIIKDNLSNIEKLAGQYSDMPEHLQHQAQMSIGILEAASVQMAELLEHMKAHEAGSEHEHHDVEFAHDHVHEHSHTHGQAHTHEHTTSAEHAHSHEHVHDPKEKKKQINRLARVIGHLEYVKRMMQSDEDCSEVLMQLAANKSALNGLGKQIIQEHLNHCITHAIEEGDSQTVDEFQKVLQKYL